MYASRKSIHKIVVCLTAYALWTGWEGFSDTEIKFMS